MFSMGEEVSEENAEEKIKEADLDGDGKVFAMILYSIEMRWNVCNIRMFDIDQKEMHGKTFHLGEERRVCGAYDARCSGLYPVHPVKQSPTIVVNVVI